MSEPVTPEKVAEEDEPVDEPGPADDDAEVEEAETEAETSPETDQPPEAPPEVTPEAWERRFAQAERRFQTYTRAVQAIWEDDAIHLTPFSLSPSAPPGFIDVRDAGRVPDEIRDSVLEYLGFAREQDYEPDPEAKACDVCKGKGTTRTGSQVPGKETRDCPKCFGDGYLAPSGTNGRTGAIFATTTTNQDLPSGPLDTAERDNWGEAKLLPDGRRNPNYGKQPQFKEHVAPWGVTANLTVQDAALS